MNEARTDRELLGAYVKGEEGAFTRLVERYVGLVFAMARRNAGEGMAEDVTQAVFILLAERAGRIRDGKALPAWLIQTTRYCGLAARRSAERRREHERKAAAMRDAMTGDVGEEEDAGRALDAALAGLSAIDRTSVVLRFYRGATMGEVAAALEVSEEAAKKRVGRAVEKLRKAMGREGTVLGMGAIAGMLAKEASAAPVGLAAHVSGVALGHGVGMAQAAMIAKGAAKVMAIAKMKWAAVWVFIIGLGVGGAVEFARMGRGETAPVAMATQPATKYAATRGEASLRMQDDSLTVEVRDMGTHEPIVGARVKASGSGLWRFASTGVTDARGGAKLAMPVGVDTLMLVEVTKDGYVGVDVESERNFPDEAIQAKFSIQLEKGHRIGGTVVDDAGNPLAGALVRINALKQYPDLNEVAAWGISVVADARGEWSTENVPADFPMIDVGAYHPSCGSIGFIGGPLKSSADALAGKEVIHLQRGVMLHGVVKGPDGKGRRAEIGIGDQREAANRVPAFETDVDGRFDFATFAKEPTGQVRENYLVVHAEGCTRQVVTCDATTASPLVIQLKAATPLEMQIVDEKGQPLKDALVMPDYVKSENGRFQRGYEEAYLSDGEGKVRIAEPFEGKHSMKVSAAGYLGVGEAGAVPGQANIIRLMRRFVVHGTVVDDDAKGPAKDFEVVPGTFDRYSPKVLQYADYAGMERCVRMRGDGAFDFSGVSAERFVVRVMGGGYAPADSEVILPDGEDKQVVIHVHAGEKLTGIVLDTHDEPLEKTYVYLTAMNMDIYDASINLVPHKEKGWDDTRYFAMTDGQGGFSFPQQSGDFTLIAANEKGVALVKAKAFMRDHTLRLLPWGRVTGTVKVNGKAIAKTSVNGYFEPQYAGRIGPYCHFNTMTDDAGRFEFAKAFPGEMQIGSKHVRVKTGETTDVVVEEKGEGKEGE